MEAGFYGTCTLAELESRSLPYMVGLCNHLSDGRLRLVGILQYSQKANTFRPMGGQICALWPYMARVSIRNCRRYEEILVAEMWLLFRWCGLSPVWRVGESCQDGKYVNLTDFRWFFFFRFIKTGFSLLLLVLNANVQ